MLTSDVIEHYGSQQAVADVLGITRQAVGQWPEMVPALSAARLERKTRGALIFDPDRYVSED